jgi:hypothetical protein
MSVKKITVLLACAALIGLSDCGGAVEATIGGTVSGLSGGTSVTLIDNGSDPIVVSSSGSFSFDQQIASGDNYNVTVETQPIGETCNVTSGSGTVDSSGDTVSNVAIQCNANANTNNYVTVTVSGLESGNSVTLLNEGSGPLTVTANGTVTFPTLQSAGTAYSVTVSGASNGRTCTASNASGTMPASGAITPVQVVCS